MPPRCGEGSAGNGRDGDRRQWIGKKGRP